MAGWHNVLRRARCAVRFPTTPAAGIVKRVHGTRRGYPFLVGAEDLATNRVTQLAMVAGAFLVVAIIGIGALSRGSLERARAPKPSPVPLVTFRSVPDGWIVGHHDAVLTVARGPIEGKATVARITVCRNAYAVAADGTLAHGLDTDATAIAFGLARRDDLRKVLTPHAATLAGLDGYYLDITIPTVRQFVDETESDTWLAIAEQARCSVVVDTSDADSGVDPAIQVTMPVIVRLGIFAQPDGGNLMVLIASEGIGIRAKPDKADIEEATGIVETFTFHPAPAQ
jgi:hypothetical protein